MTSPAITLTVIVPTWNRASVIGDCLRSLKGQTLDRSRFEVLVVDNNSTDETREVVEGILGGSDLDWRYIFEGNPGLHNARNCGILASTRDVVVFGDDDIIPPPGWLAAIAAGFADAQVGIVGGRVVPMWSEPPPDWIFDYGTSATHPVFAYLDYGDEPKILATDYVYGCNMALRRELAITLGGSWPDTYPPSLVGLSGTGETGITDLARARGWLVKYLPEAWVEHRADASRATAAYFEERHRRWAVETVYATFRSSSSWRATSQIVRAAVSKRRLARKPNRDLAAPEIYSAVQTEMARAMMRQMITVMTDAELRRHIRRQSYLDECSMAP